MYGLVPMSAVGSVVGRSVMIGRLLS
jgi:hypothetical protein